MLRAPIYGLTLVCVCVLLTGCARESGVPVTESAPSSQSNDYDATYAAPSSPAPLAGKEEAAADESATAAGDSPSEFSVHPSGSGNVKTVAEPADTATAAPAREASLDRLQTANQWADDQGRGPGEGGDKYDHLVENKFVAVGEAPLSTFSIDVDTASYSKTRMYLQQRRRLPPRDAVRIEELVNYFDYDYSPPTGKHPFAVHVELAQAPWHEQNLLARIAIKGKEVDRSQTRSNLVFLIDVSGSMDQPNKLPLVKEGLRMLTSRLGENDRVAIVVYAGAAGLVLPPTGGDRPDVIQAALERLQAGGSTNGGEGIRLAYHTARQHFIRGGVNRVILCSDGDFNVGTTSTGELVRLAEQEARQGVFLSVLGFGMGNHNDAMLEELSNKANGNYAFIDTDREARKVLLDQLDATLVTIAKDVKIQVEFNPAHVAAYRLIGYENRRLQAEDFHDDKKDAGEIGAGHTVTALYELVPAGAAGEDDALGGGDLKYQTRRQLSEAASGGELLTVNLRYKRPDQDHSQLIVHPVANAPQQFSRATGDFQFAAAVAAFGMLLRDSEYRGHASYPAVLEIAASARGPDQHGYRAEFVELVATAYALVDPEAAAYVPQQVYAQMALPVVTSATSLASYVLLAVAVWLAAVVVIAVTLIYFAWSRRVAPPLKGKPLA